MTLDQAIEILTTYMKGSDEAEPVDFDDATLLGIEALEFLSQWERDHYGDKLVILPGETKD